MQHGVDIGAGRAAGVEIGDVEADDFVAGLQIVQQTDVAFRQAQRVAIAHCLTKRRGYRPPAPVIRIRPTSVRNTMMTAIPTLD